MPRGRPRKVQPLNIENPVIDQQAETMESRIVNETIHNNAITQQNRFSRFTPFKGDTQSLARATFDKKGRVVKAGSAEYYLKMVRNGYDLVKIYNNGKGVMRNLVIFLKTALNTATCNKNKKIVEELKKNGLPVMN